ncbi:MAG: oxidoreductase [Bacteroidetes bacterium GWF2_42_66]|nr:MAG: oxidoreductase [Bacteroidetes bacterium GWA2_42_15]OFX99639.1 MAG: oxidoreductase [Bacteroidetes bacterium GWE2_42_39]OFY39542.1 MAG: oxidoreductase [Bacteroidetes bacterium GWF2_42_66]HBL73611.1 oxidoreductase [Prolixibacteraceae bacterium]HCR90275.1 oxidoreductase [Prolixibacteraceae bacterium]
MEKKVNKTDNESGNEIQRRQFIKRTLAFGALTIVPSYFIFGGTDAKGKKRPAPPSEKVNLACCGIGHRGRDVVNSLYATGLANVVALCDVDMGGPQTLDILGKFPNVPRFQDFREMFDKMGNQIDAISVGTPDFSHFPITMLAMSLGKHVYVEKPMAHTFQEAERMMQAEKKYKVCGQMGNQGHSQGNYFQMKAWTEAGIIKNVTKITAFMNGGRRWHGMKVSDYLDEQPIPETLDWDIWNTTAQYHKYNVGYVDGNWRSWYDFGNGALGDWGAHLFDTAHEFLKLGLPYEVDPVHIEGHSPYIFPQASTLVFKFPKRGNMPPVEMTWYDGRNNLPPLPDDFGDSVEAGDVPPPTSGVIEKKNTGRVIYGEGLTFKGGSHGSILQIISEKKAKEMESLLPEVPESPSNHFANFMLACKGQEECRSSFAVAAPLTQVMMLGVIAQRVNMKLILDSKKKQITNNKTANELLSGAPPRKGWEEFYKL